MHLRSTGRSREDSIPPGAALIDGGVDALARGHPPAQVVCVVVRVQERDRLTEGVALLALQRRTSGGAEPRARGAWLEGRPPFLGTLLDESEVGSTREGAACILLKLCVDGHPVGFHANRPGITSPHQSSNATSHPFVVPGLAFRDALLLQTTRFHVLAHLVAVFARELPAR